MKIRLDQYVFEHGYAQSRRRARAIIMSGIVYINGQKADKAGQFVKETDLVEVRGKDLRYVSRGGLKLEKAIDLYNIDLTGKICMDVGASTGGFTDCMLMNGAKKVYRVDVGYGQLAWKLRNDSRVVNMEKTNVRYITADMIEDKIDFFSADVSFISLKHVFPVMSRLSGENVFGVCLVKPQFEAGKDKVGKKGVVRDPLVHAEVIEKVKEYALQSGFYIKELTYSPIKGPEGNIEFLILVSKNEGDDNLSRRTIEEVVKAAGKELSGQ